MFFLLFRSKRPLALDVFNSALRDNNKKNNNENDNRKDSDDNNMLNYSNYAKIQH